MKVGYCVTVAPTLASYRLRVEIPARHLGCEYAIGVTGRPTFFYKNGGHRLAESLAGGVVYDVVNDHFRGGHAKDYHAMCDVADVVTCSSETMQDIVYRETGRDSTVIDDPFENELSEPTCIGEGVLWFGHAANIASLLPYAPLEHLLVCTNGDYAHVQWSLENEAKCLQGAAVVLMTGGSPGASANRVVKAIRAGRFVVAPDGCAESWRELAPYIWVGDVKDGIAWALNNR